MFWEISVEKICESISACNTELRYITYLWIITQGYSVKFSMNWVLLSLRNVCQKAVHSFWDTLLSVTSLK